MKTHKTNTQKIEELIERYSAFIGASIQKFNPQKAGIDVNDIAQEVKIKLWRVLQSEKKIEHHSSFIMRVVYTTMVDMMRKWKREKEVISDYLGTNPTLQPSSDSTHQGELQQLIGQAVDSLIEPRRKVIKLYLAGMDLEQTADFLGWTHDKVRNLLYRGLDDLKVILQEKGIEYEYK